MRTVLVTGGAGYVGSHACKALAAEGYRPVALDNLVHGHRAAVRWGPLVQGDIADAALLDFVFAHYRPEAVLHFAAYAYVGESMSVPGRYYANNVSASLSLLEAMRRHDCRTLVFSSSCAVYGQPTRTLISENTPPQPVNPYGRSKWMVEQMIEDYGRAHGLRWVSLRYFNAAGADPQGELGECHDPETHLIPLVLDVALGKRPCIEVYGTDYPTPDGTAVRDYVHVSDLADAHVRALDYLAAGRDCARINLGLGVGHSVQEVIGAARRVAALPIAARAAARRPGDPPRLVANPELAARLLGWAPRHRSLDGIVASAWRWQRRGQSGLRAHPAYAPSASPMAPGAAP